MCSSDLAIQDAKAQGARVVCGGERTGTLVPPTLVADVRPQMRISCDELFGPAVGVTRVENIAEDRKSVVEGKSVDLSGRRIIQKKKKKSKKKQKKRKKMS